MGRARYGATPSTTTPERRMNSSRDFDRCARHLHQLVAALGVGPDHRLIGALRLFGGLLALAVLFENLGPRRGDENAAMVAELLRRSPHVRRDRQAEQAQVADHIGDAAIEEHDARPGGVRMIGLHLPRQHRLGKELRIDPWQGSPRDQHLLLDDLPANLVRAAEAGAFEGRDQRAFSGARAAGHDEIATTFVRHGVHGPNFFRKTSPLPNGERVRVRGRAIARWVRSTSEIFSPSPSQRFALGAPPSPRWGEVCEDGAPLTPRRAGDACRSATG